MNELRRRELNDDFVVPIKLIYNVVNEIRRRKLIYDVVNSATTSQIQSQLRKFNYDILNLFAMNYDVLNSITTSSIQ